MWNLYLLAVGGLALIESFAAGLTFSLANDHDYVPRTRRSVNTQTQRELASFICSNSTIFGPTSTDWVDETERYMQNVNPQVELSVRPGCEDDVAKIVQYANVHDIPFYAVSRGHALTTSVGLFKGIEIDLSNLKSIHINSSNVTAHFQGGVYGDEVINALWEQGFVTGTGGCDCVSILGPGLGGGHGLQQGQHGLTSDHLVNLNVVLANGTAVQVNASSHPDLWWAMRGAGHNFGIVTSFDSKIWVDDFKTYFVKSYQFSGHVLDSLIDQVNEFQGNGTLNPAWLASFGLYFMNTTISQTEATISWTFLYDGPQAEAELQLQPFDNLGSLSVSELSVPYNVINNQIGGAVNGSLCEPNKTHIIGTANLQVFNVTAMRAIYDLYNQKINQHPELSDTRVLVEGYAVKGVQSFASNDSAYPIRDENILTYFDVRLNSSNDPLIDFAVEWRNQTVALWNAGQPNRKPSAYVNYAAGYESLEERYGYEPWRLQKLRELKVQYDPQNRFAWYNPIIPPK